MQNYSKRLLAVLVVLVMVFATVALVACDSDTFEYPSMPDSGEVISNGGIAVGYGDYIYYVNGATWADSDNGYTGTTKYGDIVRILASDLATAVALTEDDAEDAEAEDLDTYLEEFMQDHVEVVIPYVYHTDNTTDLTVNGLYIFGERLYFITPNPELTTNGDSQTDQSVVCSANLDGTDLQFHHVVSDSTTAVMLAEVSGTVYATYLELNDDEDAYNLVTVDVVADTSVTVTEGISSVTYSDDSAYYINEDGSIATAAAGGTEVVLVENTDSTNITYTVVSIANGCVYYTVADSAVPVSYVELFMVSTTSASKSILDSTTSLTASYTFLGYGDTVIMTSTVADTDIAAYQLYITSGDLTTKTWILPLNSNKEALVLVSIEGDILTFTMGSYYYSVDLTDSDFELTELGLVAPSTQWGDADTVGEYQFAFDDSYNVLVYTQEQDEDGDWELSYISVLLQDEEEDDE